LERGGDPRWRWRWQLQIQPVEQQLLVGRRLGVTTQDLRVRHFCAVLSSRQQFGLPLVEPPFLEQVRGQVGFGQGHTLNPQRRGNIDSGRVSTDPTGQAAA